MSWSSILQRLSMFILEKAGGRRILHGAVRPNSTMLEYWQRVQGRWDTNFRYGFMGLEPGDYDELFEAYRGLSGWIRVRLVE